MAGGIDTSKRKPRQIRNTPALKHANLVCFGILTVSTLMGVALL